MPFPHRNDRNERAKAGARQPRPSVLPPDESAAARDRLLSEIEALASPDAATAWARTAMGAKNQLTPDDARAVESGFEQRIATLAPLGSLEADRAVVTGEPSPGSLGVRGADAEPKPAIRGRGRRGRGIQHGSIDKSVLAIPSPRRYRNKEHLRFVAKQACLVCGRQPSDPHHLRYMQARALGRKASDEFTVPLCRVHHREVHRVADERTWWTRMALDPVTVARRLWERTRIDEGHLAHETSAGAASSPAQISQASTSQAPTSQASTSQASTKASTTPTPNTHDCPRKGEAPAQP